MLLDAGFADKVCVVVPNRALNQQMREGFPDPKRGLHRYLVEGWKSLRTNPFKGQPCGRAVTIQSCVVDPEKLLRAMRAHRTLLVIDEPQHLAENRAWSQVMAPAIESAVKVLMMSGTLSRGDGGKIPFIEYDNGVPRKHVLYTRQHALEERAILPIGAKRFDGKSFYGHRGRDMTHDLSTAPRKEQARTLKTAILADEYAEPLILEAMRDWESYQRDVYASKAIVVCHSHDTARRAMKLVAHHFPMARPVLAICDKPNAHEAIARFRLGSANVLVTVKMAYEGLDVPAATHLVYLGDARTFEFLDQVFARVTRVNRECGMEWEQQEARIFTPGDAKMCEYLDQLMEEQRESFIERTGQRGGHGAEHVRSTFRPDTAVPTETGIHVGAIPVDDEAARLIDESERSSPSFRAMPMREKLRIVNILRRAEARP